MDNNDDQPYPDGSAFPGDPEDLSYAASLVPYARVFAAVKASVNAYKREMVILLDAHHIVLIIRAFEA